VGLALLATIIDLTYSDMPDFSVRDLGHLYMPWHRWELPWQYRLPFPCRES
jgi:hypothetical protein